MKEINEIYYIFKSYKKIYVSSGLYYLPEISIGAELFINQSCISFTIKFMCFEIEFEIGAIKEYKNANS